MINILYSNNLFLGNILMKSFPFFFLLMFCTAYAIARQSQNAPVSDNPFFSEYKTPFQVPPFDLIKIVTAQRKISQLRLVL